MRRYLAGRIAIAIPTVLVIVVITFWLTHVLPGDPVQGLVGDFPAPPEYVAQVRAEFGLDKPLPVQLGLYLENLAHGNLGYSFANRQDVLSLVAQRAQRTLLLMIPALVLASLAGVGLALLAAGTRSPSIDTGITVFALFGYSVPVFWLAQILIMAFAVQLGWLPAQGMTSGESYPDAFSQVLDFLRHWILPGFAVTLYYLAVVARVGRASLREALQQDFVTTARSIGLDRKRILFRHVLPNGLIPIATVIGYNFGYALTGAILAETVFGWPGLGNLFIVSIANRDYTVLEAMFLLSATSIVVMNLVTDMAYFWIDPRIRSGHLARA